MAGGIDAGSGRVKVTTRSARQYLADRLGKEKPENIYSRVDFSIEDLEILRHEDRSRAYDGFCVMIKEIPYYITQEEKELSIHIGISNYLSGIDSVRLYEEMKFIEGKKWIRR